jgi:hypothetical protein
VIEAYLRELARELELVGVRGRHGRRVIAEARDHLAEAAGEGGEEDAVRTFGSAAGLAELVAAELATARTRTAAVGAFAALAVAGVYYAVMFLSLPSAGAPDISAGRIPALGMLAFAGVVFFPQLAFVAGCLALARPVRLRSRGALPAPELSVQRWRTDVALVAGLLTLLSLGTLALDFEAELASWWVVLAVTGSVVLSIPILAVGSMSVAASRPRAPLSGAAETVFDDLALIGRVPGLRRVPLPGESRRLAVAVSAAAAGAVALAGVVAGDPFDGAIRAVFEAVAVLACYRLLGGRLGLRFPAGPGSRSTPGPTNDADSPH